jgi:hypothetical protein
MLMATQRTPDPEEFNAYIRDLLRDHKVDLDEAWFNSIEQRPVMGMSEAEAQATRLLFEIKEAKRLMSSRYPMAGNTRRVRNLRLQAVRKAIAPRLAVELRDGDWNHFLYLARMGHPKTGKPTKQLAVGVMSMHRGRIMDERIYNARLSFHFLSRYLQAFRVRIEPGQQLPLELREFVCFLMANPQNLKSGVLLDDGTLIGEARAVVDDGVVVYTTWVGRRSLPEPVILEYEQDFAGARKWQNRHEDNDDE